MRLHVSRWEFFLFKFILDACALIDITVGECIPSSSQETSTRSWNSCNHPWCSSGVGLSSLPQFDSPVSVSSVRKHTGHQVLVLSCVLSSVWSCNHFLFCVWQGYQGRKHPADRARAGKTSRFWFCLHRLSGQLLCWDSILVRYKT